MKFAHYSKAYGKTVVFEDLNFEIREGEILAVLGPSGSGKTTLLNSIAGLLAYGGEIEGKPERIGYIFQEPRLLPNLTVRENLLFTGGAPRRIERLLREVEMEIKAERRPSELSGGEKQRVAIARAFLSDAPALLMDEPFSALDTALKDKLEQLFLRLWQKDRRTTVFVTHDIDEAIRISHRIVILKNGEIAASFQATEDGLKQRIVEIMQ